MDFAARLKTFENHMSSYSGDDPLDPWDRFVAFLEQSVPSGSGMLLVFEALVQRFLNVERYANDIRFVNHCIRCASFYSDPIEMYSQVFRKGIGTRTAALYVAWAQQFEQKGMNEQADAVYQKALENQAQPTDALLHEYRQFQSRARTQLLPSGAPLPLQNSQLTNQMSSEPVNQNKAAAVYPYDPPANRTVITVSRSETSGTIQSSSTPTVAEYTKEDLVSEGSELCFEEVRAKQYFHRLQERQQREQRELMERIVKEREERVQSLKSQLEKVNQDLEACGGLTEQVAPQQPPAALTGLNLPLVFARPRASNRPSSRRSLSLRLHTDTTFTQESVPDPPSSEVSQHPSVLHDGGLDQVSCGPAEHSATYLDGGQLPEPEEKLDVSQGGTANVSHITPNTSLGFVQATPSQVLPSPTVNTREAMGVIMDMFQAQTFMEEPFDQSELHAAQKDIGPGGAVCSLAKPPTTTTPFTIYQDEDNKENFRSAAPEKSKPVRSLAEISVPKADKPNDTPSDLMSDESTMWGARYNPLNSLAACPNNTTDFAMLAQFVSTPFTHKTPFGTRFFQDPEVNCDSGDTVEDPFVRRQTKKLSPIIEQSPSDDKGCEAALSQLLPPSVRQGTIVGDGLTTPSITMVQPPPPAALSFRDQTDSSRSAGPGWEAYSSLEQPPKPACLGSDRPKSEPFQILEDLNQPTSPELVQNVPVTSTQSWLSVRSTPAAEQDLDVFLSPCRPKAPDSTSVKVLDIPMSPEQPLLCADVPMSPEQVSMVNEPMTSPDRGLSSEPWLVSDPWDNKLICDLLRSLDPPLSAHPRCFSWQCDIPRIVPKTTISIGKASLRVDGVLGEGAFATVYQAADPETSEKVVLKVQKPANPWEFYINTCLDTRLQPDLRHMYSSIRSAHLFHNGSILLGELHSCGTLLNVVNIYRTLSDKVMPQPLVLYFAVCILHMVEQLHAVHIVHADIKPDNFLLGERFLEKERFDPESVNHSVVLIDFGQSIDMTLFPRGTAFTSRCLTSGFQCTEMMSGRPWNYQTDYFGIAGTVYCLLFGTYMQVSQRDGVWMTNGVFRRNPHGDLWMEFFHTLLNVPDCRSLPSLQILRRKLSAVLQQNYSNKLPSLKSRLVVQLLEAHKARR